MTFCSKTPHFATNVPFLMDNSEKNFINHVGAVQNVRLGRHHLPGQSDNDAWWWCLPPGQDKDDAMMIISLNLVDISSNYHYQRHTGEKASSSMREPIKNLIFISLK